MCGRQTPTTPGRTRRSAATVDNTTRQNARQFSTSAVQQPGNHLINDYNRSHIDVFKQPGLKDRCSESRDNVLPKKDTFQWTVSLKQQFIEECPKMINIS